MHIRLSLVWTPGSKCERNCGQKCKHDTLHSGFHLLTELCFGFHTMSYKPTFPLRSNHRPGRVVRRFARRSHPGCCAGRDVTGAVATRPPAADAAEHHHHAAPWVGDGGDEACDVSVRRGQPARRAARREGPHAEPGQLTRVRDEYTPTNSCGTNDVNFSQN